MITRGKRLLFLDWDRRHLRLVVARVNAAVRLEDAHAHRIPTGVDADDPAAMGEFIQSVLKRRHLRVSRVAVDVPRERVVINRLSLPPTPPDEVAAAVHFQAMKELPFPLDSVALDFAILGRDDAKRVTEVLLSAVQLDTLERLKKTCAAAGLTPVRIGLRPFANLNASTILQGLTERRVLFVDIGSSATEINVFADNRLVFARSANVSTPIIGGDSGREDSRILTIAQVAAGGSFVEDESVTAAVDELLVEVTRTLQAYRATEPGATVDQIVVAGGTGIETQLLAALDKRFGLPVDLFDPTRVLRVDEGESVKLRAFSAPLGLAAGLTHDGELEIDFLNPKRPKPPGQTLKRRLRLAGIALGAAAVLGIAATTYVYSQRATELKALKAANAQLRKELLGRVKVQNRVEEVADWAYDAIWPNHLLTITEKSIDPGKRMLVQEINCDAATGKISLRKLHASDSNVPAEFVSALAAFTMNDKTPYDVTRQTWQALPIGHDKFTGKVDVDIVIKDLRDHQAEAATRDKRRKDQERKLQ